MSRQSCRRNIVRLRLHRSYTMRELAETLGVHVRTVQSWHKNGLLAINEDSKPLLFLGEVVKSYLTKRRFKKQCRLGPNECYCLKCHKGVKPEKSTVTINDTNYRIGKNAKLILIKANCPYCSKIIVRFASSKTIKTTGWTRYTATAESEIEGFSDTYFKH